MQYLLLFFLLFSKTEQISLYDQASNLIIESKYKEAIKPLNLLIKENEKDDRALNLLGVVYQSINELDKAEKYFFKALSFNKQNNEARLNLAGIAYANGHINKAIILYNEALETDPKNIKALESLAVIMISLERYNDAEVFYKRVYDTDPKRKGVNMGLGIINLYNKKVKEARSFFLKEVELFPDNVDAYFNLAISYEFDLKGLRGSIDADYDNAIKYYKIVFEKDPKFLYAPFNIGLIYSKQKKYKDAIKITEEALKKLDAPNEKAYYNLACFYSLDDQKDKAINYLEKAIKQGFRDFDKIEKDPDFTNIKNEKNYIKLIKKYKKKTKI